MSRWLTSRLELEDKRLAYAALIVEEIRAFVSKETGFTCSAGISHNKVVKMSTQLERAYLHLING